jgi:hypothetical protein
MQHTRTERQVDSLNIHLVVFMSLRNCAVMTVTEGEHPRQKRAKKLRLTTNEI